MEAEQITTSEPKNEGTLLGNTTIPSDAGPQEVSTSGKWYDGVDQDILTDPTLTPFIQENGDISKDLLKSYVHAQRAIGKKRLSIPDKNTTPEEYRNLLTELGLPKDLSDYKLDLTDVGMSDEDVAEFKQKAFELGIMPDQASKFLQWQKSKLDESLKIDEANSAKYVEEVARQLQEEWGANMQKNMEKAKMALYTFAGKESAEQIINSELGSHPEFIKLMHKISGSLSEDKFDKDAVPAHYLDKTAAQRKLNEIQSDFNGPYYNKFHPAHESTVKEANELFQIIG